MRFRLQLLTLLGAGLLVLPAFAQAPDQPADEPPAGDPAMKQKLLDNFDTNKDGTLDRTERREIGRSIWENFGGGPGGAGPGDRGPAGRRLPDGPPPGDGQGPAGRRGRGPQDGSGPGRPDGPPGPPNPERLFDRFDENKDGSLSKDEFKSLTEFIHEHRPMGPPMAWRGGPGRGFDGPPRGEFERERRGGEGHRRGWWREGPPGPPPGPKSPPPPEGEAPEDAI